MIGAILLVGGELTVTVDVAVLEPGNVGLDGAVQMTVNGQPFGAPVDITGFVGLIATVTAPSTPQTGTIGAQYLGGRTPTPAWPRCSWQSPRLPVQQAPSLRRLPLSPRSGRHSGWSR